MPDRAFEGKEALENNHARAIAQKTNPMGNRRAGSGRPVGGVCVGWVTRWGAA